MRISLNWLKEYVDIKIPNDELIKLIGARLVEVEGVIDETHKYDNIYVVKVEKAEPIPDTHLTLCQINDGGPKSIQVVCGAPNVHEGMLAVWLKPGAIVPASVHEDAPFVIGKRKMLNKYESNGMLAGADELDFDDKHEKIAEIDPALAKPGDLLADIFDLKDLILDIENKSLTHRPDCFGIIGFAREVAGILGQKFTNPDFLLHETCFDEKSLIKTASSTKTKKSSLVVKISDPQICPRYTSALIKVSEATAKEKYLSKMQILLAKSGMMTNSRIVDITNYLMLLTGQPLHAFDYDKFIKVGKTLNANISVRLANNREKIVLLDDTEIELNQDDIIITSNDVPVALAGAMGGKSTMIDENTKHVLLESASFSLYNLRKTQMAHGIFSEAITRFTKGIPAGGTLNVLAKAVEEIGGRPLALTDERSGFQKPSVVKITTDEINSLLGTNYDSKLIIKTLENVSFKIKTSDNSRLEITAPYWRTDIHIKEDIIEEIGRLLGYDNIIPTLPLHQTAGKNPMFEMKHSLRNQLDKYGANEVLTYSFVSQKLLEKSGQDPKNSYRIINSISPELQFVRQSIIPSLLDKTYLNEKLPVNQFAIFEMNKVYQKVWGLTAEKVPVEKSHLAFVIADRKYNNRTAFYQAKKYVDKIFEENSIKAEYLPKKTTSADGKVFEPKRSADIYINGEYVGVVGEFKNSIKHEFKLADYVAGFEIDLECILKNTNNSKNVDFTKKIVRDLTVITTKNYQAVVEKIQNVLQKHELVADISPVSVYQADNSNEKHISVRLKFSKFDQKIMQKLEDLQF